MMKFCLVIKLNIILIESILFFLLGKFKFIMLKEIKLFKKNGFVNFGPSLLKKNDINKLSSFSKKVYKKISREDPNCTDGNGVDGVLNIPIYDQRLAEIIDKIFANNSINTFLNKILGKNFKIWAINFRRSPQGDKGLYMHQDGIGQVNMVILLDNNLGGVGATAVLPSSHLYMQSQKKMNIELPYALVNFFRYFFKPLSGSKGDILFFTNRLWHGRFSNKSTKNHDVLMIGLFPCGYSYDNRFPKKFIDLNLGTYLGNILASELDTKNSITSNCEARESSSIFLLKDSRYVLAIETQNYLTKIHKPVKLLLFVFFIRFIMGLLYKPAKFLKKLKAFI